MSLFISWPFSELPKQLPTDQCDCQTSSSPSLSLSLSLSLCSSLVVPFPPWSQVLLLSILLDMLELTSMCQVIYPYPRGLEFGEPSLERFPNFLKPPYVRRHV